MDLIITGIKEGLFSQHRPQRLSSVKLLGEIIHQIIKLKIAKSPDRFPAKY